MSDYKGYEDYVRVSHVADAVERCNGEGLMYVGATWASDRAKEIIEEIMVHGVKSQEVEKWMEWANESDPIKYLASDWFKDSVKAGATRKLQAAADRGTLTNRVWDALNRNEIGSVNDATDYVIQEMMAQSEIAKLSRMEYQIGIDLGLIDPKDKESKPVRSFQCSEMEVIPFVVSLTRWYLEDGSFGSISSQVFMHDDERKVCGTCDDIGNWGYTPCLLDLKTSTSPQPKRGARAQICAYWRMLGANPDMVPMLLIVTETGVHPRTITPDGIKAGLKDFDLALDILGNASMKGSFLSTKQSQVII